MESAANSPIWLYAIHKDEMKNRTKRVNWIVYLDMKK